jgi:hypothetical protein
MAVEATVKTIVRTCPLGGNAYLLSARHAAQRFRPLHRASTSSSLFKWQRGCSRTT